jgi:hypothetical protein
MFWARFAKKPIDPGDDPYPHLNGSLCLVDRPAFRGTNHPDPVTEAKPRTDIFNPCIPDPSAKPSEGMITTHYTSGRQATRTPGKLLTAAEAAERRAQHGKK